MGFAAAGICRAEPTRWRDELVAWLAAGKHGQMDYLREYLDITLDPQQLLPGVRSIVMVADLYAPRHDNIDAPLPAGHGRIARYARGRDYHEVVKRRLHHLADTLRARFPAKQTGPEPLTRRFRSFVDTAPILEREYAARAGLGWIGKHTLLIHPRLGSYVLLGGVATALDLQPPPDQPVITDHCGTCTRCIDACPTQAITPYSVDGSRCISYLTIEHRDVIDLSLHEGIGERIYGCDVCQEVCPHNSPRPGLKVGEVNSAYASSRSSFDLLEVLNWDEEARRAAFTTSAMKRAPLAAMKRNALIAAGNAILAAHAPQARGVDDQPPPMKVGEAATPAAAAALTNGRAGEIAASLLTRLRQVSEDVSEPELVRRTARQVLDRLARSLPPVSG